MVRDNCCHERLEQRLEFLENMYLEERRYEAENARLRALNSAAPELRAALEAVLVNPESRDALARAYRALAQAKGIDLARPEYQRDDVLDAWERPPT